MAQELDSEALSRYPSGMLTLPAATYAERREQIFAALPEGAALLLPTSPERVRSNDTHHPYRPDSDFYYVTGFDEPEAWALLSKTQQGPVYTLFVQPKDREREVWTGVRHGPDGAIEDFGADSAFGVEQLDEKLTELLSTVEILYFAFGRHPEVEPRLTELLNRMRAGRKPAKGPKGLHDAAELLADFRIRKSEAELALIRQGADITAEAHIEAMRQVRPGMHEYEIQALVEYIFRRNGAWGGAYPSIVGGGQNACVLHYVRNDSSFGDGELMLIDAGAEMGGYALDVTRTSPVSGKFDANQRAVYELVLAAQTEACDAVRPGNTLDAIHEAVVQTLSQGLLDLGLLKGSLDEVIEQEHYKRFYMHRTSHWLGLDVHDVGRYAEPDGSGRPLEQGMVLTIEPGLYIAANDETVPAAFRGMGIRIEDDVLVTRDGHQNLTGHIPRTVEDIEALRR